MLVHYGSTNVGVVPLALPSPNAFKRMSFLIEALPLCMAFLHKCFERLTILLCPIHSTEGFMLALALDLPPSPWHTLGVEQVSILKHVRSINLGDWL